MRHTFLILPALLLTACVIPPRQVPNAQETSSAASAASSVASLSPIKASSSGAVIGERLLSGGILEVGAANAPHVLRVYIHHSSSYARAFLLEQLPRLQADFINQGTLRMQLLPLRIRKYPQSERQALFVLCAAKQGKGMTMNDALIATETLPETKAAQTALGLDATVFVACLKSQEMKDELLAQEAEARQMNVTLVPDFFLDNDRFTGLPDYPDLRGRIREAMGR